jgi:hypothetical protein
MIWTSIRRTWTSLRHLNWTCQESGQGLDEQKPQKNWESTIGLKRAKGLILEPSARRTKDRLKLNRGQLRWVVEFFTGHYHLKRHFFKLGLTDDPICGRCLEEDESATHILCDSEAIAYLTFRRRARFSRNEGTTMTPPYTKSYTSFEV